MAFIGALPRHQILINIIRQRGVAIPSVNSTIAVTSTSQRVSLSGVGSVLLLKNVGATECFVAAGNSTVVAVAGGSATAASDGSMSVAAGEIATYSITETTTHLAAICASGFTSLLRVSRGEGV